MPTPRAPYLCAAVIGMRPSPDPRSYTTSAAVTCASSSIASTTLCGEATNLTSGARSRGVCGQAAVAPAAAAAANATRIACRMRRVTGRVAAPGRIRGYMKKPAVLFAILMICSPLAFAQPTAPAKPKDPMGNVELELLTHSEVYDKIHN